MNAAAWAAQYVGLPFKALGRDRAGLDCWGLVRLVYAEQLGIALPAYTAGYGDVTAADARAIADAVRAGIAPDWLPVAPGAERLSDAVLLRVWGRPLHIGVLVAPATMLHIDEGTDATVEPTNGARWARRFLGCYRHREASDA